MYKIIIPAGDHPMSEMIPFCSNHNCFVYLWKRDNNYFEISTSDPENFFWLGMDFNKKFLKPIASIETKSLTPTNLIVVE